MISMSPAGAITIAHTTKMVDRLANISVEANIVKAAMAFLDNDVNHKL